MISGTSPPRSVPASRAIALGTIAALLIVLPVASGCSKDNSNEASSASDPVARVNGVDIGQSDLTLAEEDVGDDMKSASPEAKREQLISYLADIILVTQAAEKKLADNADFKRRLTFLRNKLLMGFGLQDEAKSALTDEAMRQVYEEAVKSMGGQEEVRARHILVDGEEEAKAILSEQIKNGADFATLAKEKSKDRAPPMGATSAISARSRWCRNSPTSRSRCIRASCPTR